MDADSPRKRSSPGSAGHVTLDIALGDLVSVVGEIDDESMEGSFYDRPERAMVQIYEAVRVSTLQRVERKYETGRMCRDHATHAYLVVNRGRRKGQQR